MGGRVFVVTKKKHINFDVDIPRSAASHQHRHGNTGITRLWMNLERRGTHMERGVLTRLKGGGGFDCCVFLVTQKHTNFDVDVPRSVASCKPCPGDTDITRLQMNVGRRGACAEGGG